MQNSKAPSAKSLSLSPGFAADASMLDKVRTNQSPKTQTQEKLWNHGFWVGFWSFFLSIQIEESPGDGDLSYHGCSAAACGMGRYAACLAVP
jgi:hypothetical protein